MNRKLPSQKCVAMFPLSKSPFKHFRNKPNQNLSRALCFCAVGSLVWFSGCASNPMGLFQSMSQPSSILNFSGNNQGSKLKPSSPLVAKAAATATEIDAPNLTSVDKRGVSEAKIKPASGTETVATVSTASFVSPNPSRFKTPQDENQALSLISAKESPPHPPHRCKLRGHRPVGISSRPSRQVSPI